jgi:hypothetical protein
MFSTARILRLTTLSAVAFAALAAGVARADLPPMPVPNEPGVPQPQPPIRFPDLVGAPMGPYSPARDTTRTVVLHVRNDGLAATAHAFSVTATVSFIGAGSDLPSRLLPTFTQRVTRGIASGGSADLSFSFSTAGIARGTEVLVEYVVDSSREIGESNERNNRASQRFTIR